MAPLIRHPIVQHAFFVTDIEAACHHWIRTTGAGPFHLTWNHVGLRHTYRGADSAADLSYAFGQHGPTHVQLIAQHDELPSIYRDMYAPGEQGLHHIACLVPEADLDAECARFEAAGYPVASTLWSRAEVAYIDTRPAIGCFLELHGKNADIDGVFANFAATADGWDGVTDPIRAKHGQRPA